MLKICKNMQNIQNMHSCFKNAALCRNSYKESCRNRYTEGGIFEARVSPGSFLYLYIFLHLFHMFFYVLFVFFV